MNKILSVAFLTTIILMSGCGSREFVNSSEGSKVLVETGAIETCYKGIVYVQFSSGNSTWGSVQFGKDNKVVTCDSKVESIKKIDETVVTK